MPPPGQRKEPVVPSQIEELTSGLKAENERTLPVWFEQGHVKMLDQTRLPFELVVLDLHSVDDVATAIVEMRTRGSGAIAGAAAYALLMVAQQEGGDAGALQRAATQLRATRPTAVALRKAIDRVLDAAGDTHGPRFIEAVERAVVDLIVEHNRFEKQIGEQGASLVEDGATLLTICHAGALAGTGYGGRVLSIVRRAGELHRRLRVISMETRPYLQGARITAWELQQYGIPVTLITDGMAGAVLRSGVVNLVITGSDRVAANGDVANKVGTYMLALAARDTGVPFYVSTSSTNIDFSLASGERIPIEMRDAAEVLIFGGRRIAPEGVDALYPAFDITPARLVDGLVTERCVLRPPFAQAIREAFPENGTVSPFGQS